MPNTSFYLGLIMTVFIGSIIYGQDSKSMKFGLVAGINHSQLLSPFQGLSFKAKQGLYLGASSNISLAERIQWQPELLFSLQGYRNDLIDITLTTPEGQFVGTVRSKTSELTIAIPLLFQYRIGKALYFQGGPQLGYIVGRKYKEIENTLPPPDPNIARQYDYDYDKFDAGVVAGVGYEIGQRFDLNVRYFLALTKRENFHRSSVLSLGMGYWL